MGIKWFQLVDAAGVAITGVDSVSIETVLVTTLQDAAKMKHADGLLGGIAPSNLTVYADVAAMKARQTPLDEDESIESMGKSRQDPLIVQVPPVCPPPFASFSSLANPNFNTREYVPLTMSPLENAKDLRDECEAVPTWQAGAIHSIQYLHAFMKPLGGCTQHGKVYWRQEEKQVAAMLLDGWFRPSTKDKHNPLANKKSFLEGPPGTGKSTLFCVMAMYVALVQKRNVLVVRRVDERQQTYCLFFVAHRGDQVVYFSKQDCELEDAVALRRMFKSDRGFASVWLMLDGLVFNDLPDALDTFKLLATSRQVDLKPRASMHAYCCLSPSWRADELYELGRSIFQRQDAEMTKRLYYSGGSVCKFTLESTEEVANVIEMAVQSARDPRHLVFSWMPESVK